MPRSTNSVWDHCGLVVRPTASTSYIVEWGGGLFASELVERLTEYHEMDGRAISLRRLHLGPDRPAQEDAMEDFIDFLFRQKLGSNPVVPLNQVITRVVALAIATATCL